MNKIDPAFIKLITDNVTEVKETAENVPDWKYAADKFDHFFNLMANPSDLLWSFEIIQSRDRMHLKEACFLSRQWGVPQYAEYSMPVTR